MNNAVTGFEYKTVAGTANRLVCTHAANAITLNIDTTLLPQPTAGEIGKFLKCSAANAGTWDTIEFGSLPSGITNYYKSASLSEGNSHSIAIATHKCGVLPVVRLYNNEGSNVFREMIVEVSINHSTGAISIASDVNWTAGSYVIVTGNYQASV